MQGRASENKRLREMDYAGNSPPFAYWQSGASALAAANQQQRQQFPLRMPPLPPPSRRSEEEQREINRQKQERLIQSLNEKSGLSGFRFQKFRGGSKLPLTGGECIPTNDKKIPIDPISLEPFPTHRRISIRVGPYEYCFDANFLWGRYETRPYIKYTKGWAFLGDSWVDGTIKNPSTNVPFTKSEMAQLFQQLKRDNILVTESLKDNIFGMAQNPGEREELCRILKLKFPFLTNETSKKLVLRIKDIQTEKKRLIKPLYAAGLPLNLFELDIDDVFELLENDNFFNENILKNLYFIVLDEVQSICWFFYEE
jgi:hypothetical protein